jgi:fluoride exporter
MPRREDDGLPRDHSRYDDHVLPIDPDLSPSDSGEPSVAHRAGPTVHRARDHRVLAAIAIGGFVGTLARYGVGLAWESPASQFPWAIFTINASGSFLLGLIFTTLLEKPREDRYLRPLLCVGFLGSWTTMSTFAVGSDLLVRAHRPLTAIVYMAVTVLVGLTLTWLGICTARIAATRGLLWSSR